MFLSPRCRSFLCRCKAFYAATVCRKIDHFCSDQSNHLMSFVPLSIVYKFLKTGNVSKHPRYRITPIASHDTDALANEIGYWKT